MPLPDYVQIAVDSRGDVMPTGQGGLPDYVAKAAKTRNEPVNPDTQPQEWDPEWMKEHPLLAGMYGAGKGLLEQAIVPSIEALGMVGGSLGSPVIGTALGYGIARQFNDYLVDSYKRLGGEETKAPTIGDELLQSAADVGTVLVLGKAMDIGAKVAPYVEDYLFSTLPKRLYGSAIKTPMSKKWIQTLPNEVVSKQTAAIEEGLNSRISPSEYGLSKIKGLETEVLGYIDDITKILSEDPTKVINREALLGKGLEKAYSKAANSSDPEGAKAYVDAIAERFRAHPKNLTPAKANQIKRQLYEEVKFGGSEPSAINAQMGSVGKKGIARELMLNLEQVYPALAELNATDAARISLTEAIEKAFAKESQKSMVPLGAKVLMRPKTWPLAIWEATVGHPQVKTRLAFALHKANPVKYPAKPSNYVLPPPAPKPEPPLRYTPSQPQEVIRSPRPQPLPGVKSSGGPPEIRGVYTPEQLNKMLGSKNITEKEMAIQDIIDTRKKVEITERERVGTINTMLKNLKNESTPLEKKIPELNKGVFGETVTTGERKLGVKPLSIPELNEGVFGEKVLKGEKPLVKQPNAKPLTDEELLMGAELKNTKSAGAIVSGEKINGVTFNQFESMIEKGDTKGITKELESMKKEDIDIVDRVFPEKVKSRLYKQYRDKGMTKEAAKKKAVDIVEKNYQSIYDKFIKGAKK